MTADWQYREKIIDSALLSTPSILDSKRDLILTLHFWQPHTIGGHFDLIHWTVNKLLILSLCIARGGVAEIGVILLGFYQ